MSKVNEIAISPQCARNVLFDIDDVISDMCVSLHNGILKETNQDIPIDRWCYHHLDRVYDGLTVDLVSHIITKYNILRDVKPIEGSIDALNVFRERGYKIHLCTARGQIYNHQQLTLQWLEDYNIPHDSVSYVPFGSSKSVSYAKICDKFAYMFDDGVHNIDDAIDSGLVIKPIVVTKPWNVNETHYIRTSGIFEFCKDVGWL